MKTMKRSRLADFLPEKQYRYHYSTMSGKQREAYDTLLEGYLNQAEEITIRVDSLDEAWSIRRALCYDVPEIFYIKAQKGRYNRLFSFATIYPEYRFDTETCIGILSRMEEETRRLADRMKGYTDWEKVKELHDHIVRTVTYKDADAPYSHESPGALLYGIAVCEGISKTFKYMADRTGLTCMAVVGDASEKGVLDPNAERHAWNIVYVDACPYHIDATFDNSLSAKESTIRYDYFLLSDEQIRKDHAFEGTPPCTVRYEYYQNNGHFAENKSRLLDLVQAELRPGKPLVVKTPDFLEESGTVAEKLLDTVAEESDVDCGFPPTFLLSYNGSRMIFQFEMHR